MVLFAIFCCHCVVVVDSTVFAKVCAFSGWWFIVAKEMRTYFVGTNDFIFLFSTFHFIIGVAVVTAFVVSVQRPAAIDMCVNK